MLSAQEKQNKKKDYPVSICAFSTKTRLNSFKVWIDWVWTFVFFLCTHQAEYDHISLSEITAIFMKV